MCQDGQREKPSSSSYVSRAGRGENKKCSLCQPGGSLDEPLHNLYYNYIINYIWKIVHKQVIDSASLAN